jgi:hypothetical protein
LNNVSKMRKELKKEQRRLEMQQAYLLEQQERKRVNDMIKRNQIKKWQQTRASGSSIPSQQVPYSQAPQKGGGYEYEERLNSNIHKYFSPNVNTDESAGEETEMTDSLFGGYKQGGNSFTSKQQVKGGGGQSNSRFNGNNIHKTGVSAPPAMGSGPGELDSEDEIF